MDRLSHPSEDTLRAFANAETTDTRSVVSHLLRGCDQCSAFLRSLSFIPDYELPAPAQQPWFDAAITAANLRERLKSLSHEQRTFLLSNANHCRTPASVTTLTGIVDDLILIDPREALLLASLSLQIAKLINPRDWRRGPTNDALACAYIALANSQRTHGDIRQARENLTNAHRHLELGTGDVLLFADFHSKSASLSLALDGPRRALKHLARARNLLLAANETARLQKLSIKEAEYHARLGHFETSFELLRDVRSRENPNSRLTTIATANLARFLADSGDPIAALAELAPLQARGTSLSRQILYSVLWTSARIDRALGALESSILRMERLQRAYEEDALFRDWLLLSIDLADCYAAAARWPEALALLELVQERLSAWDYPAEGVRRWIETNTALTTRTYAIAAPALAQLANWQQDAAVPLPPLPT